MNFKFRPPTKERPSRPDKLDPFVKDKYKRKRLNVFGNQSIKKPKEFSEFRCYDYSTKESRESTVCWLVSEAKNERGKVEKEWNKYEDYYNFKHEASKEIAETLADQEIPWVPAVVPDPFVQVESQIDPILPSFEFNGRDDDKDNEKAKKREYTVKYICENNLLNGAISRNERRLLKLGDAFFKCYYDPRQFLGRYTGDIMVTDVDIREIYVDPCATSLEDAQFVNHVYNIHKLEFYRLYSDIINKSELSLDEYTGNQLVTESEKDFKDDMVQVVEHWYRQPFDGDDYESGDIACSIQAAGHELKHISRYWLKTGQQNKNFPFTHIWRIQDENGFYNKSEIFSILDLVDAADREMAYIQLNDAFTSNDILLYEENALADDCEITNVPGAAVRVKPGKINAVRRVGGLGTSNNSVPILNTLQGQIDRSTRNYESNLGRETSKVTTASGLAQLRADAGSQSSIKGADRLAGYRRLFELIDWFALEFYDDDRMIYLGAKQRDEEDKSFSFNSADVINSVPPVVDPLTGEIIKDEQSYYPKLDVTINVGGGEIKNKAITLSALDRLSATQVTKENYKILSAELDLLDISQRQMINKQWDDCFNPKVDPEITEALTALPQMQAEVKQLIEQKVMQMQSDMIVQQKTTEMEQKIAQNRLLEEQNLPINTSQTEQVFNQDGDNLNIEENPLIGGDDFDK